MINSVIACWRKIEPLWCIFSKNAWVPCNAVKVAGLVEEVNGQRDMIHQDAGNFKTRSTISLLLGTLTRVLCNAEKVANVVEEVSRRCDVIHQDAGNLNKIEYTNTFPGPGWSKMGCEYLSRELREREVLEEVNIKASLEVIFQNKRCDHPRFTPDVKNCFKNKNYSCGLWAWEYCGQFTRRSKYSSYLVR